MAAKKSKSPRKVARVRKPKGKVYESAFFDVVDSFSPDARVAKEIAERREEQKGKKPD